MKRCHRIVIEQIDWNGQGNTRTLVRFSDPDNLDVTLAAVRRGFNMDHTRVVVDGRVVSEGR